MTDKPDLILPRFDDYALPKVAEALADALWKKTGIPKERTRTAVRFKGVGWIDCEALARTAMEALANVETPTQCQVEGCPRPVHGRGLCNTHYMRYLRHGTLEARSWNPRPSWMK